MVPRPPSVPVAPSWGVLVGVLAFAPAARAQFTGSCDGCRACTDALATAGARVELQRDVEISGESACVVIHGDGAVFDAHEHTLIATGDAPLAVRVEAPRVTVRNVRVRGTATGIEVAAPEAVLFHDTIAARTTGIRVVAAADLRIVRTTVTGGRVGIAFGAVADGRCAGSAVVRSPGAVVRGSRVERADVGVAACEALPVLAGNVILRNGIGLLLGAPDRGASAGEGADAPYDACACAPALDHVTSSTALLYTSGCGGCQVHEGWLPQLRAGHHDVRARETGQANAAAAERFDAYVTRCAPELIDVLGVPGCVPNYACVASGAAAKVRSPGGFATETSLGSAEDVARFADACAAAAQQNYRAGRGCVLHALSDNTICGSRTVDVRAAPGPSGRRGMGGRNNSCGTVEGWADDAATGCASPCPQPLPDTLSTAPPIANPAESPGASPGTSLGPRRALAASAPGSTQDGGPGRNGTRFGWIVASIVALGGCGAGLALGRKRSGAGS